MCIKLVFMLPLLLGSVALLATRKKRGVITAILVLMATITVIFPVFDPPYPTLSELAATHLGCYWLIDGRFAAGYTHRAFDAIEIGMEKTTVEHILGAPYLVCDNGTWHYTWPNGDRLFLVAWVEFDANGRVAETKRYVDED